MNLLSKLAHFVTTYGSADMETNPRSRHCSAYTGGFRGTSDLVNKKMSFFKDEMYKKMKAKVREKKVHIRSLTIWIHGVDGIDPPSRSTLPDSERVYRVVCLVDGPKEIEVDTFDANGPNPTWLEHATVSLDGYSLGEGFLNVEVLRFNSEENLTDPGTSDCPSIGAVSRVKIPLPAMINRKIERKCELVKHDGSGNIKPEGFIKLAMRLEGTYYE